MNIEVVVPYYLSQRYNAKGYNLLAESVVVPYYLSQRYNFGFLIL